MFLQSATANRQKKKTANRTGFYLFCCRLAITFAYRKKYNSTIPVNYQGFELIFIKNV